MKRWYRLFRAIVIGAYFLVSVLTLAHYGVNWDEVSHSTRGQAYLYYFLTGKKKYDETLFAPGVRHSFYQMVNSDFGYHMRKDGDHPVLSDILSSAFNLVFYQKLGLLGDFEAYHFYGVVIVTLFLFFLFWWVERIYGGFAALVTILSLTLYPLFYGESHFNVQKDIPETVYLTIATLSFYTAYTQRSARWLVVTGIVAGLALGTKLNIVFLIPIIGIWALLVGWRRFIQHVTSAPKGFRFAFLMLPLIAFGLFFGSWPWLWQNPLNNIAQSFGYYRRMGILFVPDLPQSYYLGWLNTYAAQWIIFTTPLVTLFFTTIGILSSLRYGFSERHKTSLYILLLFLVPIARVSLPHTSIYGGVRQIMEYIPAMAILAGIGANFLLEKYKRYSGLFQIAVILSFLPITLKIISMHPNESVYFNPIIGGLKGARERNIPGWGNSLGSTYRQGVQWINANAPPNAKVANVFELLSNIPTTDFRSDIKFSNLHRSGPKRQGEYLIGVTHYRSRDDPYHRHYLEQFLHPVFQVEVEGVPLLKVWKNDVEHTKPEFRTPAQKLPIVSIVAEGNVLTIDFGGVYMLTELELTFPEDACSISEGKIDVSTVYGIQRPVYSSILTPFFYWLEPHEQAGRLYYLFAGEKARYVHLTQQDKTSCLLVRPVSVWALGYE